MFVSIWGYYLFDFCRAEKIYIPDIHFLLHLSFVGNIIQVMVKYFFFFFQLDSEIWYHKKKALNLLMISKSGGSDDA